MVWSSWGKSWGGGTGTSETIIVDSFGLEVSMEEVVFEEPQEFEISLETIELFMDIENKEIASEEPQEFIVELEGM